MLKKILQESQGVSLNIDGGMGQKETDPIHLLDDGAGSASQTLFLTLRAIGRSRGVLWKTLSLERIGIQLECSIYRVRLEVILVTQEEEIKTVEAYYFKASYSDHENAVLSRPMICDPRLPFVVPYELGWIHFDQIRDLEIQESGLGQSLAYGAPGIKVTIFQYNREQMSASDVHKLEFLDANKQFLSANPSAVRVADRQGFSEIYLSWYSLNDYLSVVGVAIVRGCFLKIRITYICDPILDRVVVESLSALNSFILASVDSHSLHQAY